MMSKLFSLFILCKKIIATIIHINKDSLCYVSRIKRLRESISSGCGMRSGE